MAVCTLRITETSVIQTHNQCHTNDGQWSALADAVLAHSESSNNILVNVWWVIVFLKKLSRGCFCKEEVVVVCQKKRNCPCAVQRSVAHSVGRRDPCQNDEDRLHRSVLHLSALMEARNLEHSVFTSPTQRLHCVCSLPPDEASDSHRVKLKRASLSQPPLPPVFQSALCSD